MYRIYQVEYGDTIDKIANKSNTTSNNIKDINGFTRDEDLIVGSLIIVPKSGNQYFDTYKVEKGDSIYSIAQKYGVKPETVNLLNGLNKNDYIYPNQELLLPKKGMDIYVTKDRDTLNSIIETLGIDANTLNSENGRIFIIPDQLIIHKKEVND